MTTTAMNAGDTARPRHLSSFQHSFGNGSRLPETPERLIRRNRKKVSAMVRRLKNDGNLPVMRINTCAADQAPGARTHRTQRGKIRESRPRCLALPVAKCWTVRCHIPEERRRQRLRVPVEAHGGEIAPVGIVTREDLTAPERK